MSRINVLVTAVGGPTALGILRCLKDIASVYLIGVDSKKYTAGNKFCDKVYQVSSVSKTQQYISEVSSIVAKEKVDIVFPTLQEEILVYHEFGRQLQTKIALPLSHNFDVLVDKEKLYRYLEIRNLGRYVPKYYAFDSGAELRRIIRSYFAEDEYVCVKRAQGHGGLGLAILTSREKYLESIAIGKCNVYDAEDYCSVRCDGRRIVMEYLDGDEYSVDVMIHAGNIVAVVPRRRERVSNGIVIEGTVEHNRELIDAASCIAKDLIDDGFINLQFIMCDHGYKLTDVNPRFCGSQVMSMGAGVNFPYLYIQYNLLDECVLVSPRWNTRMLRYWESYFFYD